MVKNDNSFIKTLRINQTNEEKRLWYHLRNRRLAGIKFRRQKRLDKYIVDFVSPERKLIIELDGYPHRDSERKLYDIKRTLMLKNKGYRVLRFWNSEVVKSLDRVVEKIEKFALLPSSQPSPQGEKE